MNIFQRFRKEEEGAAMVEMAIALTLLLTLTLGFVDFGYAFWQWNAATKAVQVGARMASVSPPVAPEVKNAGPNATPGDPIPVGAYSFTCYGTGPSAGTCTGSDAIFNPGNFNRILCGDAVANADGTCGNLDAEHPRPGMYHFFPRLRPQNLQITYAATGLGYQTRPGGAVPTITVEIRPGLPFQFFFLSGLRGFGNIDIPPMRSTVTGEDLGNGA
jgi:Flp pilus assembly pilin Flp